MTLTRAAYLHWFGAHFLVLSMTLSKTSRWWPWYINTHRYSLHQTHYPIAVSKENSAITRTGLTGRNAPLIYVLHFLTIHTVSHYLLLGFLSGTMLQSTFPMPWDWATRCDLSSVGFRRCQ